MADVFLDKTLGRGYKGSDFIQFPVGLVVEKDFFSTDGSFSWLTVFGASEVDGEAHTVLDSYMTTTTPGHVRLLLEVVVVVVLLLLLCLACRGLLVKTKAPSCCICWLTLSSSCLA